MEKLIDKEIKLV